MNDHSKRLIESVFNAINRYDNGLVEEEELLRDIEGISSSIEEEEVYRLVSNLALKVDESRYLYDVKEGKAFLSTEIAIFKQKIKILDGTD